MQTPLLVDTRACLLVGATGLVGGHLLDLLIGDTRYRSIHVLSRSGVKKQSSKLVDHHVNFDDLSSLNIPETIDDVYCCLGTTIKKAGSEEAFRKVDEQYPLAVAEKSIKFGAKQYIIVTAVGADPKSSLFYNRVKGQVEEALKKMPFAHGVKIIRPSMLLGDRNESRPLESLGQSLMSLTAPLFVSGLQRYRAIDAKDVALAMLESAWGNTSSSNANNIYEGESLFSLVHSARALQ